MLQNMVQNISDITLYQINYIRIIRYNMVQNISDITICQINYIRYNSDLYQIYMIYTLTFTLLLTKLTLSFISFRLNGFSNLTTPTHSARGTDVFFGIDFSLIQHIANVS